MRRLLPFLLFLFLGPGSLAQVSPEKLIGNQLDKSKWLKAGQSIRKALSKDTLNPEARYLLALYYYNAEHPTTNLDSAYRYAHHAYANYAQVTSRERDRLRRVPLDSGRLEQLINGIDSTVFEQVKKINTEAAYQRFIATHPGARQYKASVELRDEVSFLEALKVNTWFSFQNYLNTHPQSHRRAEAQARYDRLLFEDKTKFQTITAYQQFCDIYPNSPYRAVAERNLFQMVTARGTQESFQWFMAHYPNSREVNTARNILFALQLEEGHVDPALLTDSLRQVEMLCQSYWIPIYKSGLFGFMNDKGEEVIAPAFERIDESYRCGEVKDRLLLTSKGVLARNGAMVWKGAVSAIQPLGAGFVRVSYDSGSRVIHESGLRIDGVVSNAQLLGGVMLGLQHRDKWAVFTLAGRKLLGYNYDDLASMDSLVVLTRGAKKVITTLARLARLAEKPEFKEEFVFDDVRRWGSQQYWVRNGPMEGVLNDRLQFVIPLDRQVLRKTSFGFLREKESRLLISGIKSLEGNSYLAVQEQGGWIRLLTENGKWSLYERGADRLMGGDSIWFQGQLAFLRQTDSLHVLMPTGARLSFGARSPFQIKEFRDSSVYLILEEKKKKVVFEAISGLKLFGQEMDQVDPVRNGLFIITRGNKRGLVGIDGKLLLPIEYDAIVPAEDKPLFSLLKDKKFGWYDFAKKSLTKPTYERNIRSYNSSFRLAYKDKGYAFLDVAGKAVGNFEWEDVDYWTDSVAWGKKNNQWTLFEIRTGKQLLQRVRGYTPVNNSPSERFYVVQQDNVFGVISSKRGVIIPIQYSDIINLGSREMPMYFTERHIAEAGISVVIYYDYQGKIVRKQAMEAEEFEKVYCDN
ncbi:MAG TPA: hypothetical protein PLX35_16500 [Cyclobacteriaceae bacterium]|nr:hypothetical protein [Cyclobacteriaceae bacterium]